MGVLHQLSDIDFYCCNRSVSQCITFMSRNTTPCCCLLFIFVAKHVTQCKVNQHEGQRDSGEMYSSYTFSVRYSPTHRMLKQKPCVTDLLTSCSGRLSNPTWPPKLRLRFSSFYRTHTQKKKKNIRSVADVRKTHGRVIIQKRMAQILKRSHSNAWKHQRPSAHSAHVKSITL